MKEDMSNKVDKLFKDKLEGDSLQPSARAWEKVESHLSKKNKMVLWLRVAAAVALLGLLTFAALNWNSDTDTHPKFVQEKKKAGDGRQEAPLRSKDPERDNSTQISGQHNVKPALPADRQQFSDASNQVAEKTVKKKIIKKLDFNAAPTQEQKPEIIDAVPQREQIDEQMVAVVETPVVDQNSTKGITLTYSLPAIRKTEAPQVAAVEQKKSGLGRVLEIAKEVKNSDTPLGDLREAKDEIFAFEFRKDKTKKSGL